MMIPLGVDQPTFARQALAKGIKITSKFPGVVFKKGTTGFYWYAQCQHKNHPFYESFAFTEKGEIEAGKRYAEHMKSLNIKPRKNEAKKFLAKTENSRTYFGR